MLSVVCPSNRIGGLDVLFAGLAAQTLQDFELVLVDNLYKYRRGVVADKAKAFGFPVRHVPPRDNPFPRVAYCETMNTGIANSRGETLVYLCDYTFCLPDCLATHAAAQAKHPAPLLLDFSYTELPRLLPNVPTYTANADNGSQSQLHSQSPEEYRRIINEITLGYRDDLEAGKLDAFLWSVFDEPITEELVRSLPVMHTHYKGGPEVGPFDDYNFCCFKNESFPTELMLEMNGHEERYDRSHVYQDHEFSYRLRRLGIPWFAQRAGEARCLDPHKILTVKYLEEPTTYNQALCYREEAEQWKGPANPEFSLRGWRERTLAARGGKAESAK